MISDSIHGRERAEGTVVSVKGRRDGNSGQRVEGTGISMFHAPRSTPSSDSIGES